MRELRFFRDPPMLPAPFMGALFLIALLIFAQGAASLAAAVSGLRDSASDHATRTDAATYALPTCPPETDEPTPDDDIPPERSEPMETCSRVVR